MERLVNAAVTALVFALLSTAATFAGRVSVSAASALVAAAVLITVVYVARMPHLAARPASSRMLRTTVLASTVIAAGYLYSSWLWVKSEPPAPALATARSIVAPPPSDPAFLESTRRVLEQTARSYFVDGERQARETARLLRRMEERDRRDAAERTRQESRSRDARLDSVRVHAQTTINRLVSTYQGWIQNNQFFLAPAPGTDARPTASPAKIQWLTNRLPQAIVDARLDREAANARDALLGHVSNVPPRRLGVDTEYSNLTTEQAWVSIRVVIEDLDALLKEFDSEHPR